MKIRVSQFIDFAYGDKRKDKAKVKNIIDDSALPYDPTTDRYKQFREALKAFEELKISKEDFLSLHSQVAKNKSAGYKVLCRNYLDLKEDYALTWEGRSPIEAEIAGLHITTSWHLRTEANNQIRIVFLNFRKEQLPREKQKGLLTILRLAKPESAGVGILNIQSGTLTTATRLDQAEADYIENRASKFMEIVKEIQKNG